MTSDSDIFLKAIDVLEVRGWCQERVSTTSGSVCALGSVAVASGYDVDRVGGRLRVYVASLIWPSFRRRMKALSRAAGVPDRWPDEVAIWNDAPGRTYEDVILALKRAAHGEAAIQ